MSNDAQINITLGVEGSKALEDLNKSIGDLRTKANEAKQGLVEFAKSGDTTSDAFKQLKSESSELARQITVLQSGAKSLKESLESMGANDNKLFNRSEFMEMQHVTRSIGDEMAATGNIMRAVMLEGGRLNQVFSDMRQRGLGLGDIAKGIGGMFVGFNGLMVAASVLGPMLFEAFTKGDEAAQKLSATLDEIKNKEMLTGTLSEGEIDNRNAQYKALANNTGTQFENTWSSIFTGAGQGGFWDAIADHIGIGQTNHAFSNENLEKWGKGQTSDSIAELNKLGQSLQLLKVDAESANTAMQGLSDALRDPDKTLKDANIDTSGMDDVEKKNEAMILAYEQLSTALEKHFEDLQQQQAHNDAGSAAFRQNAKDQEAATKELAHYGQVLQNLTGQLRSAAEIEKERVDNLVKGAEQGAQKETQSRSDLKKAIDQVKTDLDNEARAHGDTSDKAKELASALETLQEKLDKLITSANNSQGGQSGDTGATAVAPPKDMAERQDQFIQAFAQQFMKETGASAEQAMKAAAAAAGNVRQESGFDPTKFHDQGTPGHGEYASIYGADNERGAAMQSWLQSNGLDNNLQNQSRWMAHEVSSNPRFREGLDALKSGSDVGEMAAKFGHNYEGFGDNSTGTRSANARQAYSSINRQGPTLQPVEASDNDAAKRQQALDDATQKLAKDQATLNDLAKENKGSPAYLEYLDKVKKDTQAVADAQEKIKKASQKSELEEEDAKHKKIIADLEKEKALAEQKEDKKGALAAERKINEENFRNKEAKGKIDSDKEDPNAGTERDTKSIQLDTKAHDQEVAAKVKAIKEKEKLDLEYSKTAEATAIKDATAAGASEQQITKIKQAAEAQRENITQQALQQEMGLYTKESDQYKTVQNQMTAVNQQANQKRLQQTTQSIQQEQQAYQQQIQGMMGAFTGMINSMIGGHTKLRDAAKQAGMQILSQFERRLTEQLSKYIANQLAMTAANAQGVAQRNATSQASEGTSIIEKVAQMAASAIGAGAGQTAAGVSANVAPVAGPAAPGIGAAAGASVMATSMGFLGMASFDQGSWELGSDMVAMVHQGEMIVPAGPAQAWRNEFNNGMSYGGGDTHHHYTVNHASSFNISAMDSKSLKQMFDNHGSALMQSINKQVRQGAHMALSQNPKRIK